MITCCKHLVKCIMEIVSSQPLALHIATFGSHLTNQPSFVCEKLSSPCLILFIFFPLYNPLSLCLPPGWKFFVDVRRYSISPLSTTVHSSNSLRPSVFTQQNDYRQICPFSSVCLQKVQNRMSLLSFPHKDCSGVLSLRPYEPYRLSPLMTVP